MQVASVLLCAGLGTRLLPLTRAVPKPALPLLDVPLGAFGLALLARDVPPVVVNVSHLGGRVRSALEPWAPRDDVRFLVEEPEPYGTAGTLRALRDRVDRRVLTLNGDALIDLEPCGLLAAHERLGAAATVAVAPVATGADLVVERTRVTALIDRRTSPHEPGWLFVGMAVFERSALELLDTGGPRGLTEGLLLPLIGRGDVAAHEHSGYVLDVGTPERYLRASLDVLGGSAPQPVGVPGERIGTGAESAYRGPGARAHHDSLGPGAVLLRGATAEPGSWIERSVVWPGEHVAAGTSLVGSIRALGETLRP